VLFTQVAGQLTPLYILQDKRCDTQKVPTRKVVEPMLIGRRKNLFSFFSSHCELDDLNGGGGGAVRP
jgi:hypothetical protein